MKRVWLILGGIVLLLVLAVAALPFLVNADVFRPAVQSQLGAALGRDVHIGSLKLSLLSGGVAAEQLSIGDDPRFSREPFLRAKSVEVGVDILPMILSRTMRVRSLTLNEPDVVLLHARSGQWNFSSLGKPGGAPPPKQEGPADDLAVDKLKIVNGRITVGQLPAAGKMSTYSDVNLTANNLSYATPIPFTLEAKTPGGGTMKIDGTAGPINRADAALSPLDAKVAINHMDLASTGFLDPASGLAGILDYTGTVKSDGTVARSEGKATIDKMRVVRTGSAARAPVALQYLSDYNLKRQAGAITRGEIHTGSSTAQLTGDYDTRGESTLLHMKLRGNALPMRDVEALLPAIGVTLPTGASLQGGTVNADLALDGPADRLVTSGTLNVQNAKLTGFSLASKLAALSAFTGVRPSAETLIQTLSSNLRIAPDGIRADNLNLLVPELGTVTGGGIIGANNAMNFRMVAKPSQAGLLGAIANINPLRASGGAIPFLIQGTTQSPLILPDVRGAVTQTIAPQSQGNGLGGILGGLFGKKKPQK